MKTIITKSAICVILATLLSGGLNAQTYPDYLFGTTSPQTMNAMIRQYSPTEAVSVHYNYRTPPNTSYSTISVVDISGNIKSLDMEPGYEVYDMEITSDYLIMCGRYNSSDAFIGCVYIPNISTSSATVYYHTYSDISYFSKMVAYKNNNGDIKVLAVGEIIYSSQYPALLYMCFNNPSNNFDPCGSSYMCGMNLIVEVTNPQTTPMGGLPFDVKFMDDINSPGFIDDVVLTDNYVVFVGQGNAGGNPALLLYRCNRNNTPDVLSNFGNYYYFNLPISEHAGFYIGCHMEGDTIAVTIRGSFLDTGWSKYDTRIRVIDAASMVMTSSQAFDLNGYKADPQDLVYLPQSHTLVLLEDIVYPAGSGVNNFSFIFLNPYQRFQDNPGGMPIITPPLPWVLPYTAKGFHESNWGLTFWSMDRIVNGNAILSTGGDYWMIKSIPLITANHSCYKPVSVDIYRLYDVVGVLGYHNHPDCSQTFTSHSVVHSPVASSVRITCF